MATQRFAIAHVTPYPWESRANPVNATVAELAAGQSAHGHRVLILAPSRSPAAVRASRRELRAASRRGPAGLASLLDAGGSGQPLLVAIGEVLDVPIPGRESKRARVGAVPVDVTRTLEELLGQAPLDFVHVHDPLPPSASSAAVRHSRALNVGSFYSPPARPPATALGRRFSESLLGRLDARVTAAEQSPEQLEQLYQELSAKRHDRDGDPALRRQLEQRPLIDVDLHMHTDHSHDCETPVEVLLATAAEAGLGAIAVTDHNEISGALEAREKARGSGVKVIVGEEVKTASQGEVIGLFIEEKIPRGMSLRQTIAEIKRQGGVVYVPHPFDRMHAVPDYEHLLPVLDQVDALEVFNPRVAIGSFNEEAARFAAKYRIPAGAGSDSHVSQGLGSVRVRMHDFDGPEEFLQSLRDAEIATKPTSLIYVQALKFLQTKARPPATRRAVRARRVRKVTRGRGSA
ncbi:MAG TPA: PHP domain-containing protein [Solirubrobacteraceae bacterium]|nr:PHP domain-containing protein [Solirubrobacteraceae bacterium]